VTKIIPTMKLVMLALGAGAASLCCNAPAAHALAGSEAWCIVTDEGNNHCNYATAQQCLAAAAGSHDFCNENSSGGSAPPAAPQRAKRR
jgi:hypothetical protein